MPLQTLGALRLGDSEFRRPKPLLLLAYVSLEGPKFRRYLADLFYMDAADPLNSLSRALSYLRTEAGVSVGADEHKVWTTLSCDAAEFITHADQKQLEKALALYQGTFLESLDLHLGSELEEWVYGTREYLAGRFRNVLLQLAEQEASKGNLSQATKHAERACTLTGAPALEPDDIQRLYTFLQAGKSTLASKLRAEAEDFDIDLSGADLALREVREAIRHNLPTQATEFIGREVEKAKLAALLSEKTCRLVTIVAPGGMGKTRLAIEASKTQLENFSEICFVSFAAIASAELMVYTLADALELSLFGSKSPKKQVLDYLKNKNMLLVLDNLEHLLAGIDFLSEILATAAELKFLATSRERLSLQSEHLFDLYGLTVEGSHDADALRLFAERAKHNCLDFVLGQNLEAVTKICQLVGGMPLAIELAASWSRLLTPSEILKELEQNLDLLIGQSRDLPERHHSMRSVFEASWQRLSEEEQTALRKLSVFQGGFTKEAARAVADTDLNLLLTLLNKSFVWRDTTGRFSQHPLILQYSQKKAKDYPEERKQVEEKHGLYYLELVKERAPELRTHKGKEARIVLDNELPNTHAAWDWTLREKRVEEIKRYARALGVSFEHHNDHEGMEMFKQAVVALDEANPKHQAALGYSLIHQARREFFLDHDAKEITQHGLALLEPLKEYPGIVTGFITLGDFTFARGDLAKAKEIYTAALGLARTYGSVSEIGWVLTKFPILETQLGSFSEVSALMQNTLKELRELGDRLNLGFGLTIFGSYLIDNDQLDEGEELLLESLDLGQKTAVVPVYTLSALARLAYKRGDFQKAETYAQEVYEIASKQGDEEVKTGSLAILGRVKLAQGHLAEAEHLLLMSLRLGWVVNMPLNVVAALVCLSELSMAQGQVNQAVALLSFLSRYQVIWKRDRDEALQLLEKAKAQLSPQDFTQAQKESKSLTLEGIVTGILEKRLEAQNVKQSLSQPKSQMFRPENAQDGLIVEIEKFMRLRPLRRFK